MLNIVEPNKEFLVCRDACKEEIKGVLMQEGHVICYKEGNYLLGRIFLLMTDHSGM
jgi:hypothetical protein